MYNIVQHFINKNKLLQIGTAGQQAAAQGVSGYIHAVAATKKQRAAYSNFLTPIKSNNMGTINKGILGGFSGTVGNVVGGSWKGIDYMRSKSNRSSFNASDAQLAQQLKFGISIRFLQSMNGLVEVGFKNYAIKKTGINSALSFTLKNAVTGTYPAYTIQYSDVLVSRGDLPNVLAPTVVSGAGSVLTFSWTDNSGVGIAKPTDKAILAAYSPDLNQCIYTTGSADRSAITDDLLLGTFSGLVVETYIGFISENGRNIASSIYTGQVTVS